MTNSLAELITHAEEELRRHVPAPDGGEELSFNSSPEPWRSVLPAYAQASFAADFDNFGYSYDLTIAISIDGDVVVVRGVCSRWDPSGGDGRWNAARQGDLSSARSLISELIREGTPQMDKQLRNARANARRRLAREKT